MTSRQAPTSSATGSLRSLIGRNIRFARDAAGMTQGDLATELGVRESQTISNWERGLFRPSDENLIALARALDRDVAWFYTDHSQESTTGAAA